MDVVKQITQSERVNLQSGSVFIAVCVFFHLSGSGKDLKDLYLTSAVAAAHLGKEFPGVSLDSAVLCCAAPRLAGLKSSRLSGSYWRGPQRRAASVFPNTACGV